MAYGLVDGVGDHGRHGTLITEEIANAAKLDTAGLVEVREDNREAIANAIDLALVTALEEVGLVAEGYAKRACPVDTGRLRNSTTHIVDEGSKCAVIGTNVEYAPYVELGTRHQKPQPYLKPATEDHESTYRSIFRKHLGASAALRRLDTHPCREVLRQGPCRGIRREPAHSEAREILLALTRKMLKAMGIEDEKIDQIIDEHAESVNALKAKLDYR